MVTVPNKAPHRPAATLIDLPGLGVAAAGEDAGMERSAREAMPFSKCPASSIYGTEVMKVELSQPILRARVEQKVVVVGCNSFTLPIGDLVYVEVQ
jgi:hypothetical protein